MRIFPPPALMKNLSGSHRTLGYVLEAEILISSEEKHGKWPTGIPHGLEEKWQGLRHGSKRL